jgi:hypothetical protein
MLRAASSIIFIVTFCWPQRLGETIKQVIRLDMFAVENNNKATQIETSIKTT